MDEPILFSVRGKIAVITLNLAAKLNALTQELYLRLALLLNEVAQRDDIYITLLTGRGRFFSAYVETCGQTMSLITNRDKRRRLHGNQQCAGRAQCSQTLPGSIRG